VTVTSAMKFRKTKTISTASPHNCETFFPELCEDFRKFRNNSRLRTGWDFPSTICWQTDSGGTSKFRSKIENQSHFRLKIDSFKSELFNASKEIEMIHLKRYFAS
jgi:hypothetical protein